MTRIRDAGPADVDAIVALHLRAFPSFLLTTLGPRFLRRLYAGYTIHPTGVLLVALDESPAGSAIAGFVAGTTEPEAFYGWLRRTHGGPMAIAAIPALVKRPAVVGRRLVAAARYRGESPTRTEGAALLASLAVDPAAEGRGVGRTLVDAFVERARQTGHGRTYCSTDTVDNERVLAFYRRSGFHEAERIRRSGGREMAILIRAGEDDAAAAVPDQGPSR